MFVEGRDLELERGAVQRGDRLSLEVDFGNGARFEIGSLPWQEEMRVIDLMAAASRFRPAIRFRWEGEGAAALVTAIDGLSSEGPDGRNWQFWVNDTYADEGAGVYALQPGDRVLWRFSPYE